MTTAWILVILPYLNHSPIPKYPAFADLPSCEAVERVHLSERAKPITRCVKVNLTGYPK